MAMAVAAILIAAGTVRSQGVDEGLERARAATENAIRGHETITGTLQFVQAEGGFWVLECRGRLYDLHGDLGGIESGDRVTVKGRTAKDTFCIHTGVVFRVDSIARADR
jgi:hypothetical protein